MLTLKPFTTADLSVVAPCFEDADTRRWLGGPVWPLQGLALVGRDRRLSLATDADQPVGMLDVEVYHDQRAGFALVTAPAMRGRGVGTAMLDAMFTASTLASVEQFFAGIEAGNVASERLVRRAGYVPVTDCDEDGFIYFARARSGMPGTPWSPPSS